MGRLLVLLLCVVLVLLLLSGWTLAQSGRQAAATGGAPVTNASDLPDNDRPRPLVAASNGLPARVDPPVVTGSALSGPVEELAMQPARAGLWGTLCAFFEQVATFDHDFDNSLWNTLSGELRAVLGALKCLVILLVLTGLCFLGLIKQLLLIRQLLQKWLM